MKLSHKKMQISPRFSTVKTVSASFVPTILIASVLFFSSLVLTSCNSNGGAGKALKSKQTDTNSAATKAPSKKVRKKSEKKVIQDKNCISLPNSKREYKWGGQYWVPNGYDKLYRIENQYHGMSITAFGDGRPVHTQQVRSEWPYRQDFIFEKAGKEPGVYYIGNYDWMNNLFYLCTQGIKPYKKAIEITAIKVLGYADNSKQETLLSKNAKVTMSKPFNDSLKAANANDGNLGTAAVTTLDTNPWIEFDLGKESKITYIEITDRQWTNMSMRDALITVFNSEKRPIFSVRLEGSRTVHRINLKSKNIKGRYIKAEHKFPKTHPHYVASTAGKKGKDKLWKITLVDPRGFYKIENIASGLVIQAPKVKGPDLRTESHVPVQLVKFKQGDPTMMWAIEPMRNKPIDCLAVSQIGYAPKAIKNAILVRTKKLKTDPEYTIYKKINNNSGIRLKKGKATFVDSRFTLFYYKIDFSDLTEQGDYLLDCDGDRVSLHIADDAYLNIRHRAGTDITHLVDVFDSKRGFITHWGRITTWCKEGANSLNSPFWMDQNPNNGQLTVKQPPTRVPDKFIGGWDHTDRVTGALQPSAVLQQLLVLTLQDNNIANLKKPLIDEIKFGAEYFVNIQSEDGSWPLHTHIANVFTGTVASVGMSLAASVEPLKKEYPELSKKSLQAAIKAWDFVEKNPDKWVKGVVCYRHGRAEEKVMLAVELFLATGDEKYRKASDDMILNSEIKQNDVWGKTGPGFFTSQSVNDSRTTDVLLTFMRYYPKASDKVKKRIKKEIDTHYQHQAFLPGIEGAFGMYETGYGGYGGNSAFLSKAIFFYKVLLFNKMSQKYKQGYIQAERIMNWLFGCNEFDTSMVFGFGDIFSVPGWLRAYEIGSVQPGIGAIIKDGKFVDPPQITCNSSYGNMESEAAIGVKLVHSMLLRNKLKNFVPEKKSEKTLPK